MPQLLSVGQLIDHSWEMYRKRFTELMGIAAWLYLPVLLGIVALAIYPGASTLLSGRPLSFVEATGVILWLISTFIAGPAMATWIFVVLIKVIVAQISEKRANIGAAMRDGQRLFWPLVLVNLLIIGVLFLPWAFTIPGWIVIQFPGATVKGLGSLLLSVGILVAAVVSVRWLIYYSYASITLSSEEMRGRAALRRSRELIEGRFWSALIRMILPKIIFFIVLATATGIVAEGADTLLRSYVGLNADLYVRLTGIVTLLLASTSAVLINPLLLITDCLIYENLRETLKSPKP